MGPVDQSITLYCPVTSILEVPVDAGQAGRATMPRLADPQHLLIQKKPAPVRLNATSRSTERIV
jgi:hypothetical protein